MIFGKNWTVKERVFIGFLIFALFIIGIYILGFILVI